MIHLACCVCNMYVMAQVLGQCQILPAHLLMPQDTSRRACPFPHSHNALLAALASSDPL